MLQYNQNGWNATFHFNFQGLYNKENEIYWGVSNLVVFNDDTTIENFKWGAHSHANAEVVTYLIDGQLKHKDSMGSEHIMNPGDFQIMSTGSGLWHSEEPYNGNVHLFQMWFVPNEFDVTPSYEFINKESYKENGEWIINNSMNTNLRVAIDKIDNEKSVNSKEHINYITVIDGDLEINNKVLKSGDVLILEKEKVTVKGNARILILDMPDEPNKRFDWYKKLISMDK